MKARLVEIERRTNRQEREGRDGRIREAWVTEWFLVVDGVYRGSTLWLSDARAMARDIAPKAQVVVVRQER